MANDLESRIASLEFANARLREQIGELRLFLRIFALEAAVSIMGQDGVGPDAIKGAELFIENLSFHLDEEEKQLSNEDRSAQRTKLMIEAFGRSLVRELETLNGSTALHPQYKRDEPA